MNEHQDKHDKDLMPESSGIVVKPVAFFIIILAISTVFVFVAVKGLTYVLNRIDAARTEQQQPATRVSDGSQLPQREPLLQGAPLDRREVLNKPRKENEVARYGDRPASNLPLEDMAKYREKVEGEVKSYGWAQGKENSEARIPVERAKQLLLEKGLPTKADTSITELQNAEKVRRQIYDADASGGRLIGKQ
jgi:hypothetical protein